MNVETARGKREAKAKKETSTPKTSNSFETKGNKSVVTSRKNSAGKWESVLFVNNGETATSRRAIHNTEAGAKKWANQANKKYEQDRA